MLEDKPQINITEEIPAWRLRLAYFYTEHKMVIKKGFYFLLFFIDLIIIFILGVNWIDYRTGLIKDQSYLQQLKTNLVDPQAIKKNRPHALLNGPSYSLSIDGKKYNLLAEITNKNRQWAIEKLIYTFITDNGKQLQPRSTFVLPNSHKYLMYFNVKQATQARLKIINIKWRRIKDFSLISYKDQIKINSAEFKPSSSKIISGISSIEIYNDSPYGYWKVGLPIILYDKQLEPLAINYITINKLGSQEKRHIEINWASEIKEKIYQTKIYPEINLLDKNIIMKISSPPSSPAGYEQ